MGKLIDLKKAAAVLLTSVTLMSAGSTACCGRNAASFADGDNC